MTRLSVLLVALLLCGGCGQREPARDPAPPTGTRVVTSAAASFDVTARAFVELAIATNEQAVKLLDRGATHAKDPALRTFAGELAATRRTELAELRGILGANGIPYVDHHAGHDMPGMPTEVELVALDASDDFDADFTRLTRAHLTESETVAKSARSSVTDERAKALAEAMARERGAAVRSLDALG